MNPNDKTQQSYPKELHQNLILTKHQFRQYSLNASQTSEEAKKAQSKCQISENTEECGENSHLVKVGLISTLG